MPIRVQAWQGIQEAASENTLGTEAKALEQLSLSDIGLEHKAYRPQDKLHCAQAFLPAVTCICVLSPCDRQTNISLFQFLHNLHD